MLTYSYAASDPTMGKAELRQQIRRHMWAKRWKNKDLSQATGITESMLSNLMKGKQSFTIKHIDAITASLGLLRGSLYPLYVWDCLKADPVQARNQLIYYKIVECIPRCYLNYQRPLGEELTQLLLADRNKPRCLQSLLTIVEHLYHNGFDNESLSLYNEIIKQDRRRSMRVAISLYRTYIIHRVERDVAEIQDSFYHMLEYVELLPTDYEYTALDGERHTYNLQSECYWLILLFYNAMADWDKLYEYACILEQKARIQDGYICNPRVTTSEQLTFLGESLVYQSIAYQEQGELR